MFVACKRYINIIIRLFLLGVFFFSIDWFLLSECQFSWVTEFFGNIVVTTLVFNDIHTHTQKNIFLFKKKREHAYRVNVDFPVITLLLYDEITWLRLCLCVSVVKIDGATSNKTKSNPSKYKPSTTDFSAYHKNWVWGKHLFWSITTLSHVITRIRWQKNTRWILCEIIFCLFICLLDKNLSIMWTFLSSII